jgi:hypothetical protein
VGLKITLMVHVPPAATVAQVFCCVKPVLVEIVPKIRGALPVFVTVTVCAALLVPMAWLGKLRLLAESDTAGWSTPVPVSRAIWGLSGALSVIVSAPTLAPGREGGVKVTVIVQFEGGEVTSSGAVQVLVPTAKSPLAVTLVMINGAVPVFVTRILCGLPATPTV